MKVAAKMIEDFNRFVNTKSSGEVDKRKTGEFFCYDINIFATPSTLVVLVDGKVEGNQTNVKISE